MKKPSVSTDNRQTRKASHDYLVITDLKKFTTGKKASKSTNPLPDSRVKENSQSAQPHAKVNGRSTKLGKEHPLIQALNSPPEAGENLRALLHLSEEI